MISVLPIGLRKERSFPWLFLCGIDNYVYYFCEITSECSLCVPHIFCIDNIIWVISLMAEKQI
jgi:hypothetical protein